MIQLIGGILGGGVIYVFTGYLVFRGWTRLCPPQNGQYGNTDSSYIREGWYVPAVGRRTCKKWKGNGLTKVNVGMAIEMSSWLSLLSWPVMLILFGVSWGSRAATYIVKQIAIKATNVTVNSVIDNSDKSVIDTSDPVLMQAKHEVEEMLRKD